MLKPSQILASEWAVLRQDMVGAVLDEALAHQPERHQQAMEALHFYDAFLGITDAEKDHAFTSRAILEFRGFLTAEVDFPTADALRVVWLVGDWLVTGGLITEQDVQFALNQDESFAMRFYKEASPLSERIKYYSERFEIRGGSFVIDLSYLDEILSEPSQQSLRDWFVDYLRDKNAYQARTDVELIYSILLGYVTRWPARELSATLSAKETISFISEIRAHSDWQMAGVGYTRVEANQNFSFLMNVIRQFFMRNGIFATLSKV